MIEAHHLHKNFGGVKAVDDVTFEVKEQETLVLLGTSGCGKTTTLKMLNRLLEPESGEILIAGKNIRTQPVEELRRSIGYVLQNHGLFPHYTVAQNIAVVPQLLHWDKSRIENRTAELLEKLHLPASCLDSYPHELSGGQQQRIGLARALAADPPILLMDEPFGALDVITRSKIRAEFKQLDELKRKTIIMVTHDVQEAFELGDRICLMDQGKIIRQGTPAELLFGPQNNFVTNFLSEQRLHLELRVVKIAELWPWLPAAQARAGKAPVQLPASASLWEVLEQFRFAASKNIILDDNNGNEARMADFEQLMSAYYQYKKQQSDE